MLNQIYLGKTLKQIYLPPRPGDHHAGRARLVAETLTAQMCLFRLLRELQPFSSEARYISYLRLRHAFSQQAQQAYLSNQVRASIPDLDRRSRLRALARDLSDVRGAHVHDGRIFEVIETPLPTVKALGWILVAEAVGSFSPIFLRDVKAIGLDEHFGATHLGGSPEYAQAQWRRLCIAIELMLRDGLDMDELMQSIHAVLKELHTLAVGAMR